MRQPSMAALIDILKQQKSPVSKRNWNELEDHVKHVYESLLNMKDDQIVVARNVQMRGRNGQLHQIDVYYEFEKAGIRHRVAIECKNTKRRIDKSQVSAFWGVIDDCPGVMGIMISAGGYQEGATKFATDHGILPLTLDDLPSLSFLLAMRLEHGVMPDEKVIGEPFWTLFELEDGEINGTPYGQYFGDEIVSVLFFSKKHAEEFRHTQGLEKEWAVRGLSQLHLRNFILTVDAFAGKFVISVPSKDEHGKTTMSGAEIFRSDLIAEYCISGLPIPEKPMVAPSRKNK